MNILGLNIDAIQINISGGIPAFLESEYEYYSAKANNMEFVLMHPVYNIGNITTLRKHMQLIHNKTGMDIAIWVDSLSNYRKEILIQNEVPFILGDSQLYLPFLGAILHNSKSPIKYLNERFVTSAQMLLLLYVNSGKEKLFISDAVNVLPFSNMTITRAVSQLVESNLFKKGKDGVRVFITTDLNAIELYKNGKPYFCSPIHNKGYIDKKQLPKKAVVAGLNALSKMSMLAEGKNDEYAVEKFDNKMQIADELFDYNKQCELQIWKYNPLLFSKNELPDAFSIAVALADNSDPRVEECIEEMLKNRYM